MDESTKCPILDLPTELRLIIYGYALIDVPNITIGSAELVGSHPDIVHRLYGDRRKPFPGLPLNHEPVIEPTYTPSLLSLTTPALIPLTPATIMPPEDHAHAPPHLTRASLQLVNKQIKHELDSHAHHLLPSHRRTSLFVSYPDGLHILRTLTPGLLAHARSLHLAGSYSSRAFVASRAACLGSSSHPPFVEQRFNGGFTPNSAGQLSALVASLFGPRGAHAGLSRLELRVYYPGSDSYSTVWGDDNSPTVIALRNVLAGEINIEVWRGQRGTGVYLSATRVEQKEGERAKRVVSTVWRRLEEGRRGEPQCGSWVVDPRWPRWEEGGVKEWDTRVVDTVG